MWCLPYPVMHIIFDAFISALSASSQFCIRWSSIQALLCASFQFSTSNLATSPPRLPLTNVILVHAKFRLSTKLAVWSSEMKGISQFFYSSYNIIMN